MVTHHFSSEADLMEFLTKPPFEPVMYRHVKRGSKYLVVSDGEYQLNDFSAEGSIHVFSLHGEVVECELQFSGDGTENRYAGEIVVYCGEDGKYWIRPRFEFFDGRFERVEA